MVGDSGTTEYGLRSNLRRRGAPVEQLPNDTGVRWGITFREWSSQRGKVSPAVRFSPWTIRKQLYCNLFRFHTQVRIILTA